MGTETTIIESALCEVTGRLWTQMLSCEVALVGHGPDANHVPELGTVVRITGEWNGCIEILSSLRVGENIACCFFDKSFGDGIERALVEDALKEIVNITGGNLKTVLPEPCILSVPEMMRSLETSDHSELVADLLFASPQGVIEIRVLRG